MHSFRAHVFLGEVSPDDVRVELYSDGKEGEAPLHVPMAPVEPLIGAANGFLFAAQTSADVPASDFTLRVLPYHPQAIVPLEARHILWR